jgi:hypothetical protein
MVKNAKPWEEINFAKADHGSGQPGRTLRLKVPGGWLVATDWGAGVHAPTFLSDPEHTWNPAE